jgi:uncharacterized membrane protein
MANSHVIAGLHAAGAPPAVRKIAFRDIKEALAKGVDDFMAMPSHLAFICLIYPLVGIGLAALTFTTNALPLLFPLASGFALIGPLAAVGLYEVSRRRELGLEPTWQDAFEVLRSPAMPSILALGLVLLMILVCWLFTAQLLYEWIVGPNPPDSYARFIEEILGTSRGWTLIIVGNAVGFVFAAIVLTIGVVSFPMLLDRHVGPSFAVETSARAVQENPIQIGLWGLIVAVALVLGSLPLFVGLAVVMPVLGHATWHLYRRLVEPAPAGERREVPAVPPRPSSALA